MEVQRDTTVETRKPRKLSSLKRISNGFINLLETAFYRLGWAVASYPVLTIGLCVLGCGLCAIGMKDFKETNETEKLWVPASSRIQREKKWVMENFPPFTRYSSVIFTSDNILLPKSLKAMLEFYKAAKDTDIGSQSLDTMCFRVGPFCHVTNILELWYYDENVIDSLTTEDIIRQVNNITTSPMYHNQLDMGSLLGKIRRDSTGNIVGAEAASMLFLLYDEAQWRPEAMEWELKMVDLSKKGHSNLNNIFIYTSRSFDDEGYGAVNADVNLLTAGFSLVLVYLILTLGRFNLLHQKFYLSLAGLLSVGLAIGFAYGLAIACGVLYGPVHALMPFLLLGIGVDDMFVIVEAWKNLSETELKLPLVDRMALSLKHAGVSVTVTSITDVVAFAIGASTVIPGLSGFCIYAALGIFALYVLQSTFFVACLTLDQRKVEASRDGCIPCYVYKNYTPNSFSQMNLMTRAFERYIGPSLMKFPVKIMVLLITLTLLGVNIWGFYELKQDFDLTMYIPSDSYAHKYADAREEYFPSDGQSTAVYCGDIDYYSSGDLMKEMYNDIVNDPYVVNGSVVFWFSAFTKWLNLVKGSPELATAFSGDANYPNSEAWFSTLLYRFVYQTPMGQAYRQFIKFENATGKPVIMGTYLTLRHTNQPDSKSEIVAMESLRYIVDNAGLPPGKCFAFTEVYLTYETNKILQEELYRNLLLAVVCVFFVTLLLIAHLQTSVIVFTCVIFTLVDVAGTLHFWGVTIDTASSILLTLSVGLAVDYSAHIGHMFMTVQGTKPERALLTLKKIGPAVFSGGFSTFLAFLLLCNSYSYGFSLFFRVFFSVVVFGLFHGLIYLPVVLSWIGPDPYESHVTVENKSNLYVAECKCNSHEESTGHGDNVDALKEILNHGSGKRESSQQEPLWIQQDSSYLEKMEIDQMVTARLLENRESTQMDIPDQITLPQPITMVTKETDNLSVTGPGGKIDQDRCSVTNQSMLPVLPYSQWVSPWVVQGSVVTLSPSWTGIVNNKPTSLSECSSPPENPVVRAKAPQVEPLMSQPGVDPADPLSTSGELVSENTVNSPIVHPEPKTPVSQPIVELPVVDKRTSTESQWVSPWVVQGSVVTLSPSWTGIFNNKPTSLSDCSSPPENPVARAKAVQMEPLIAQPGVDSAVPLSTSEAPVSENPVDPPVVHPELISLTTLEAPVSQHTGNVNVVHPNPKTPVSQPPVELSHLAGENCQVGNTERLSQWVSPWVVQGSVVTLSPSWTGMINRPTSLYMNNSTSPENPVVNAIAPQREPLMSQTRVGPSVVIGSNLTAERYSFTEHSSSKPNPDSIHPTDRHWFRGELRGQKESSEPVRRRENTDKIGTFPLDSGRNTAHSESDMGQGGLKMLQQQSSTERNRISSIFKEGIMNEGCDEAYIYYTVI